MQVNRVIAGADRNEIRALIFPDMAACRSCCKIRGEGWDAIA